MVKIDDMITPGINSRDFDLRVAQMPDNKAVREMLVF